MPNRHFVPRQSNKGDDPKNWSSTSGGKNADTHGKPKPSDTLIVDTNSGTDPIDLKGLQGRFKNQGFKGVVHGWNGGEGSIDFNRY